MKQARTVAQGLLNAADFPGEILTGVPVVELKGRAEAVVIQHRGIVAYDEGEVRIASSIGPVTVSGAGLRICRMNRERIVLRGEIQWVRIGAEAP